MSGETATVSSEEVPVDRVLSAKLEDWTVAGGPLRLDFSPERTVLLGKNGAGKSILLQSIYAGALAARHASLIAASGPGDLCWEMAVSGKNVSYSYHQVPGTTVDDESAVEWRERCWHTDTNAEIWHVSDGIATLSSGTQMPMPPGTGLLMLRPALAVTFPKEVADVRRLLMGVKFVPAGVPRNELFRGEKRVTKAGSKSVRTRQSDQRLIESVGRLVGWFEEKRAVFDNFVAVGRRLELFQDVDVEFRDEAVPAGRPPVKTARVLFDGVDAGFLADGTLRVIEIILPLVDPSGTVVLIEEPETGIHPGLLRRLLAEIEAHSVDRQLVMTTHSPLVVDSVQAAGIRLVERISGRTVVRNLSQDEMSGVAAYLGDNLNLSDFVYSRES